MNNNEKIQRAEQLIAEAHALLNEVKANGSNEEDVIAKYKENYCKGRKYFLNGDSEIQSFDADGTRSFEEDERLPESPYQYYLTKELAEQAKKLKDFNDKLLAFKYCYDLDYKPVFSGDYNNHAYFVYYNLADRKYDWNHTMVSDYNAIYFSTKEIAQKCADWLNSLSDKILLIKLKEVN